MTNLTREILGRTATTGLALAVYAIPLLLVAMGGAHSPIPDAAPDPIEGVHARLLTTSFLALPEPAEAPTDDATSDDAREDPAEVISPPDSARVATKHAGSDGEGRPLGDGLAAVAPVAGAGGTGNGDATGNGATQANARKPWRNRKPKNCNIDNPNIRAGADGVLEIDRSLVDHYTENLESFMTLGYSRPHDEEGLKGWYISGFSCTSPVAKAGFQRGDILLSVNGKNTRNWVGVFMMYQRLKNKDAFEVALVRKGEPVTLKFRVVPG